MKRGEAAATGRSKGPTAAARLSALRDENGRYPLTEALIERLPTPEKGRATYFDRETRGLCVRVTPNGERTYYFVATVPETKTRAWVKLGDARSLRLEGKDGARSAAKAKAGEVAHGRNPNVERRQQRAAAERARIQAAEEKAAPTVAGLVGRYIEARERQLSPVTHREYLRTLNVNIRPSSLGKMRAKEALRSHVRDFHQKLRHGRHQADRALLLLRAAYRWALEEEVAPDVPLVDRDATRGVEAFVRGAAKIREWSLVRKGETLTEAEVWHDLVAFWKGTEALTVRDRAFARLLLLLGLRRGEASAARWRDVVLEEREDHTQDGQLRTIPPTWTLPAENRKGREDKGHGGARRALVIPLPPTAVAILKELREVTGKGERLFPHLWLGGIGARVKERSGLSELRLHDLRRSTASGLERLGCPPHVISAVLGHVEAGGAGSDRHYKHGGRFEEHATWLRKWSEHIARIVGEGEPGKLLAFEQRA
jgi:integrase